MDLQYDISLSEYPNEIALVLYHSPCSLCCDWCFNKKTLHNSLLNYRDCKKTINDNYDYISSVCLTGGEPLLAKDFYKISQYITNNDLKLKLNTSGIIPISQDTDINYVNISIKGDFLDYQKFGYQKSENELIQSINSLFVSDFIEFSIVYYRGIDLKRGYDFIKKLYQPSLLTLSQLQRGNCLNPKYNSFAKVTRQQLLNAISFYNMHCKYYIETKEFGKEEVKK